MKELLRKWLGIEQTESEFRDKDLDLWERFQELEKIVREPRCYENGMAYPKETVLYAIAERLKAVIDYLDIEFEHSSYDDPQFIQRPIPQLHELKARKKKP